MNSKEIFQNGLNKAMKKDYKGALLDFDIAIRLEPNKFPGYYNNRGTAKSYLGDKKGALEDYNIAIKMNPNSSHFFFNRAEMRAFHLDYSGAVKDYNKSLSINPIDKEVILQKHLAELYLEKTKNKKVKDEKINLFISYSHVDEELKIELDKHLSILKRMNFISDWHDRKIIAGQNWGNEIDSNLEKSNIFLALVSSDFITSDYCYSKELEFAIKKHELKECIVIPIILRPVIWKLLPIGKIQALPKDGKPITSWSNQDDAFLNVAEGILIVINKIRTSTFK